MSRQKVLFGTLLDGRKVYSYHLENKNGMSANILNFGCVIYELNVPTKDGKTVDVALGYDGFENYMDNDPSFGAVIGRIVGPVPDCKLEYNGKCVMVEPNNPDGSHCHGGKIGFKHALWTVDDEQYFDTGKLVLMFTSPDGTDGYPEEIRAKVVYTLSEDNRLILEYYGESDAETPYNPTNHCSFNLEGHAAGYVGDHIMRVNHDYVVINQKIVPIGETALDVRVATKLDDKLHSGAPELEHGFDNFHFIAGEGFRPMMTLYAPKTGIEMEISSDANGAIVYSCYWLNNIKGKDGAVYDRLSGMAFEPCRIMAEEPFNSSHTTLVGPDKPFYSRSEYKFSVR